MITRLISTLILLLGGLSKSIGAQVQLVPYHHGEQSCIFANELSKVDKKHIKDVAYQVAVAGDCLFHNGQIEKAMEYWLISSINESAYGLEVAGRMSFTMAKNHIEVLRALSILSQLEKIEPKQSSVFYTYKALAYTGNYFLENDDEVVVINFKKAIDLGSMEAGFLAAYFVKTGLVKLDGQLGNADYWIRKVNEKHPEASYETFIKLALNSPAYDLSKLN
ncbi:MAG: hypothetical protein ACFHVJ_15920 [Aestuariibacter sp.]